MNTKIKKTDLKISQTAKPKISIPFSPFIQWLFHHACQPGYLLSPDSHADSWGMRIGDFTKSFLNKSSTFAKEFINEHGTLFRSSIKASRLKRLKFRVSITLGGGDFKRCSLQTIKIAERSLKPTGFTP